MDLCVRHKNCILEAAQFVLFYWVDLPGNFDITSINDGKIWREKNVFLLAKFCRNVQNTMKTKKEGRKILKL